VPADDYGTVGAVGVMRVLAPAAIIAVALRRP